MNVVSVSSKGQVVIPERMRKSLGIKAGSRLVFLEKEDSIMIKKEDAVVKQLGEYERKEEIGWLILGEKSLAKVWDNAKDEKTWKKYM